MLDTETVSERYIAELPYLMGYEPKESVVAFWLHADSTMSFAQRTDISDLEQNMDYFVTVGERNPRTSALILFYSDRTPSELWDTALLLGDVIEHNDIHVHDILKVNGLEYSTFFAPQDELDSQEVLKVRPSVRHEIEDKYKDTQIVSDRDSLMSEYECAGDNYQYYNEHKDETISIADAVSNFIVAYESLPYYTVAELAPLAMSLHNIKVRDEVLIQINSLDKEGIDTALRLASYVLRVTPQEHSAPIYTVTAIMAWLKGNGALANMLIETALEVTPDYNLAVLINGALSIGMSPNHWKETISEL
jgi:hypothetical protein